MKKITELLIPALVLGLGLLPAVAFLVWIERNMALPWVGTWIQWPWIFIEGGLPRQIGFDLGLIFLFGFLHSVLARRAGRSTLMGTAGISAFLIMAAWQPTGVILYQLIPSAKISSAISLVLYWSLLAYAFLTVSRVKSRPIPADVRTLLYILTFAAWILTPMMSLDRLIFISGMAIYFFFAS